MADDAPSAGWQGVYAAMAVSTDHERRSQLETERARDSTTATRRR